MMSWSTWLFFLLTAVLVHSKAVPLSLDYDMDEIECLPCTSFFSQLELYSTGEVLQETLVQLRGEPKSGTGLMYFSVIALLKSLCSYLEMAFGPNVCMVELVRPLDGRTGSKHVHMMFDMGKRGVAKGGKYLKCSCNEMMSAHITFNSTDKHTLPVDSSCPWQWGGSVVGQPGARSPCSSVGSAMLPAQNPREIDACIADNDCDVTDQTLQSVIIRDPRASVVSAYFHLHRVGYKPEKPIDEWVIMNLPNLCKRILVRLAFFGGQVKDNSIVYRYEEAVKNPEKFHRSLSKSLELDLPDFIIKKSVSAVEKPLDVHKGGVQTDTGVKVGFEAEVRPETLETMNAIMRHWFSPDQLAKWSIEPA